MIRALVLGFVVWLSAVLSWAGDPFTVAGVPVDARGPTAIQAQTDAILDGQTRAAARLMERLTYADDRAQANYVPPLPEEATRMIRAMSVANEKRSADRYIGDITVAFVPRAVRAFAEARGLTLLETQARERVVLPIASGAIPMSGVSPFTASWSDPALGFSLTPLRAARVDPSMVQALDIAAIRAGDASALAMLRQVVGASQVTLAEQVGTQSRVTDIDIDLGTVSPLGTFARPSDLLRKLEGDWKQANANIVSADPATQGVMQVTVLFDDLRDWQRLQEAIGGAARVSGTQLGALSKGGALMTVRYVGDLDSLSSELRGKGARLEQHPRFGTIITRPGYRLPDTAVWPTAESAG